MPFAGVYQERPSRAVQSKAGIYLELVAGWTASLSITSSSVSLSPALGERFSLGLNTQALVFQLFLEGNFLIRVDSFD